MAHAVEIKMMGIEVGGRRRSLFLLWAVEKSRQLPYEYLSHDTIAYLVLVVAIVYFGDLQL